MKKLFLVLTVLLLLIMSGCSDSGTPAEESNDSAGAGDTVEVEKGLFDVTVTLPAAMIEADDIEATIAEAKEMGVKEVVVNDDGSLTYKMSKSTHGKMMRELREGFDEAAAEIINGEDFVSIKEIKSNKDLTAITLIVEKEAYENSLDGFASFGLALIAMYYQLFDGVQEGDISVTINIEDFNTGEVFNTIIYPDALETD